MLHDLANNDGYGCVQTCSQDRQCQDQDQDQDRKWQYETKCTQSELELDDIFTFNTLFIYFRCK